MVLAAYFFVFVCNRAPTITQAILEITNGSNKKGSRELCVYHMVYVLPNI